MASDLISRKALLERLEKIYGTDSIVDKIMLRFLKKLIRKQPTVDAEPVIHAEWKHSGMSDYYRCSNCGFVPNYNILHGRCPKCGQRWTGVNDMNFKLSKEQTFVRQMVRAFKEEKMSYEEAVLRLQSMYFANNAFMDGRRIEVEMAIKACRLQTPKPPSYEGKDPTCGDCGTYIFKRDRFCPRCGQKIKWGDK